MLSLLKALEWGKGGTQATCSSEDPTVTRSKGPGHLKGGQGKNYYGYGVPETTLADDGTIIGGEGKT